MLAVWAVFAVCGAGFARAQVPALEDMGAVWLAANESSGNPPTQTNFLGASAITADPADALGVDSFDAYPYVGWLRTRVTALDDSGAAVQLLPNGSRWLAHRTERRASWQPAGGGGGGGGALASVSARVDHRFLF